MSLARPIANALSLALLALSTGCVGLFREATPIATSRGTRLAQLIGPDVFARMTVTESTPRALVPALAGDETLVIIERGGERLAFLERELAWHHVAEGTLGGEPFAVVY